METTRSSPSRSVRLLQQPRSSWHYLALTFLLGTGIIVQRSRATDMLSLVDDAAELAAVAGRGWGCHEGWRATATGMKRRASCATLETIGAIVICS